MYLASLVIVCKSAYPRLLSVFLCSRPCLLLFSYVAMSTCGCCTCSVGLGFYSLGKVSLCQEREVSEDSENLTLRAIELHTFPSLNLNFY
jgi:hypothetical protein